MEILVILKIISIEDKLKKHKNCNCPRISLCLKENLMEIQTIIKIISVGKVKSRHNFDLSVNLKLVGHLMEFQVI